MLTQLRSICLIPAMLCLMASGYAQTQILHFGSNEYALTPEMQSALNKDLEAFKQAPNISITGHTDADGSDGYNLALGEKRATSVKAYLISMGVDARNIEIYSSGESQPLGNNQTAEGKEVNRRVEVVANWVANPEKNLIKPMLIDDKTSIQVPQALLPSPIYKTIDPTKANDVPIGDKGTVLHIPANAFVDAQGNVVKDHVKLAFTEYKNAADMAFSEISMTYQNDGEEMRFNSAGMFSLYGTSNGKDITIRDNTEINVDYALATQQHDIAFYGLQNNDTWELVENIAEMNVDTLVFGLQGDSLVLLDSTRKHSDYGFRLRRFNGEKIEEEDIILWDPKTSSQMIRGVDAGHQYPDIVRGLSVGDFGVYNCDQIYRIGKSITINPVFVDEHGQKISDGNILSLIDLNYNGAFSFDPNAYITLDANGRNVLLLFTKSNKLYLISESEMKEQKLNNNVSHTFTMKNVTEQLNSTEKLSEYLGLN